MVISGVAERAPERIRRLVYLDAFVPENGKCLLDLLQAAVPARAAAFREEGARSGWVTPPAVALWGHVRPEDIAFVKPRENRHPFGCFTRPVRLASAAARALPRTFIYCSSPATGAFDQFAAKFRRDPAWRFHELATGHDCMILVPDELATVLLQEA
jgi:pimeloyl-ACP methyl ester carboxylesterase